MCPKFYVVQPNSNITQIRKIENEWFCVDDIQFTEDAQYSYLQKCCEYLKLSGINVTNCH